ncbi:MAG: VanZ family protein, partial [Aurantibacter sp.]
MSLFKSDRERRLWIWALIALIGIYSTLFLSGILTKLLQNQNFSAFVFLLAMALIAVSIFTRIIKIPGTKKEIWVWIGIVAVYSMFFLRLTLLERSHLIEYSVLAILIHEALKERAGHGGRKLSPALLAILITLVLGTLDE